MSLAVPPSLIARMQEGAAALARDTAEAIDNGENLRDCARRLQAIAALQDALSEHTGESGGTFGSPCPAVSSMSIASRPSSGQA